MVNVLLLKFVSFYSVFALFLTGYATWTGQAATVGGWKSFTDTIEGGPLRGFPNFPKDPNSANEIQQLYLTSNVSQLEDNGCPHTDGHATGWLGDHPDLQINPFANFTWFTVGNPLDAVGNNYTWSANYVNSGGTPVAVGFLEGKYAMGLWFDWYRYNATAPRGDSVIQIKLGLRYADVSPCPRYYTMFKQSFTLNQTDADNGTGPAHFHHNYVTLDFEYGHVLELVSNGSFYMDIGVQNMKSATNWINFRMNPDHSYIDVPPIKQIWDNFGTNPIAGVIKWVAYGVIVAGWCLIALFMLIGWSVYTIILFFIGLFALSFSNIFGPFGTIIGLFTLVFFAYILLTVVYWIRGTTGSIGV